MVIPYGKYWTFFSLGISVILYYLFMEVHVITAPLAGSFSNYSKFVSPIQEELFRFLSIFYSIECSIYFTLLFSLNEMLNYLSHPSFLKIPLWKGLIIRGSCVGVHFFLLLIQINGFKRYQNGDREGFLICLLFAILFHHSWNNGLGTLFLNLMFWVIDSFSPFFGS